MQKDDLAVLKPAETPTSDINAVVLFCEVMNRLDEMISDKTMPWREQKNFAPLVHACRVSGALLASALSVTASNRYFGPSLLVC